VEGFLAAVVAGRVVVLDELNFVDGVGVTVRVLTGELSACG